MSKRTVTVNQISEKYNRLKYGYDNYLFFPVELSGYYTDYKLTCETYINESTKSFGFYGTETRVVLFFISFFASYFIFRLSILSLIIGGGSALFAPNICSAIDKKVYEKSKKKAEDSLYEYMLIKDGDYIKWRNDYYENFNQKALEESKKTGFSNITEETIKLLIEYLRHATNRIMYSTRMEPIMLKIIVHESKVEIRSSCSWMTGSTLCQIGFDNMNDAGPFFTNAGFNLQPVGRMALLYFITEKINTKEKMNLIFSNNYIQFRLSSDDDIKVYCDGCDNFQKTDDFKTIIGAYGIVQLYVKKI